MSEALTYDPIKPEAVAAIILMIVIGACAARFFMCLTFFCSPYSPCTDADEERLRILPAADGHADGLAGDDSGLRDNEWAATRPATFTGLPMQEAAKRYYRAILPLALLQVISLVLVCQILLPLGAGFTDAIVALILHPFVPAEDIVNGHRSPFEMVLVQMAFVLGVVLLPIGQVAPLPSIFRRLRKATEPAPKGTVLAAGQKKPGDVTARRPKRHVIVIPAYKEPIPVLTRTLDSLEYQTYGSQRITILMAMEGADATADATFDELQTAFSGKFAQMIKTVHFIQPGELAGKSANENFAVRELHKQWAELDPSLDPYDVLVTITDADSVFSPRYIEQLDWVYSQQPAPHLLMYHPVFDTRRNFFEAHPIIAKHEANRCTSLLLLTHKHGGLGKVAMSNYSLSLGFARDIEYWTADNMPEDCHTTLKAFVYSHGADVLVPVYAVISNDLVPGFSDRYVQAKRHAYACGA